MVKSEEVDPEDKISTMLKLNLSVVGAVSLMVTVVPLSGVGVLPKPTAACLALDRSDFLIFGAGLDANLAALKAAVLLFLDLMPEEQGDYLGSVTNLLTGAIPLTHMSSVDPAAKNAIRLKLP